MSKTYKPGQPVPTSGQYLDKSRGTETTLVEDKRFPPTAKPKSGFILVDETKHKPPNVRKK